MQDEIIAILTLLLKLLAVYLLYHRFIKMCYLRWLYGKRGVTFMCTIPKPFIGDVFEFVRRIFAQPDRSHLADIITESFPEQVPPCIGMFWPHGMMLIISDADYVQDLFTTYNEVFQKQEYVQNLFSNMIR